MPSIRPYKTVLVALALLSLLPPARRAGAAEAGKTPSVGVQLLAERTAAAPGKTVELAVKFKIERGWHIYWHNPGEGGLGTKFKWQLPAGFSVGPLRWPAPQRHVDGMGAHTFILEGEPVMLATLTVPADARPGTSVPIGVEASWLLCREMCVLGRAALTLNLPIAAGENKIKPANEGVFRAARNTLPTPAGRAKYMQRLRAAVNVDKVRPGDKFAVAVVLDIADGYHVNAHQPLSEYLIPTDVFPGAAAALRIGRPRFPPARSKSNAMQMLSVYSGRTVVFLPAEADGTLTGHEMTISGVVTYQACEDKSGVCYPPTAAEWALLVPIAGRGEAVSPVNAELFKAAPEDLAISTLTAPAGAENGVPVAGQGFTLDGPLTPTMQRPEHSLAGWLLLALLAGVILNVTPCVLPVIAIKVLSFVQQAGTAPGRVFKLGLAFALGMLLVFNVLAVLATAAGLLWGQHFQSPLFTVVMAAVVFAFALSVFGVFTLGVPRAVSTLAGQAESEGCLGSIGKGALATVMGTPCLGPFLGSVLIWVAGQPPGIVFLVFNTIGVGMALPYILLTANPRWLRFIPQPGPWLTTFKQAMAFLLIGTVVYLLTILNDQLGGRAVVWTLAFLLGVALACWIVGTWLTANTSTGGRALVLLVALAVVGLSAWLAFGKGVDLRAAGGPKTASAQNRPAGASTLPWVEFSLPQLTALTAAGQPVLLDITAAWCPNCKWNSEWVFNSPEVARSVEKYKVVPMLADWTAHDESIARLIEKLAPGGSIPLCAVFPAGRPAEPIVMLGIVTKGQVLAALKTAASLGPKK